jgi:hypothetical protein
MVRQLLELTTHWELRFVVFTPQDLTFAILDNVVVANYGLRIAPINSESFRRVSRLGTLVSVAKFGHFQLTALVPGELVFFARNWRYSHYN